MFRIMTLKELADYLKVHKATVLKYAKEGKIPGKLLGRSWVFDKEVIDRWIAKGNND